MSKEVVIMNDIYDDCESNLFLRVKNTILRDDNNNHSFTFLLVPAAESLTYFLTTCKQIIRHLRDKAGR